MAMLSGRVPANVSWIRAAVVLPMGFASALGFAAVQRHWLVGDSPAIVVHAERPASPPPPPPVHVAPPPVVEAPSVAVEVPPERPAKHSAMPLHTAPKVERTPSAIAEENARLVVEAMGALRRAHDPARASSLLDEYLRRCPDGPLSEEALALSVEAASADDDPRGRSLAAKYLAAYPRGRFREAAERVLSRSAP
jgi:hypothetical protein